MKELLLFLRNYKWQSLWIIISSFIINLLALASALYVIQVFNRYLNYQIDSTLYALTIGVFLAFTIEIALRLIRSFLINKVSTVNNRENVLKGLEKAISFKLGSDKNISDEQSLSIIFKNGIAESMNIGEYLSSLIDVFFAFLFIATIMIISIQLGIISLVLALFFLTLINFKKLLFKILEKKRADTNLKSNSIYNDIRSLPYLVRAFNAGNVLYQKFQLHFARDRDIYKNYKNVISIISTFSIMLPVLSTILIIFFGSQEVVANTLTVGALVGINVLNSRVYSPLGRVSNGFFLTKYKGMDNKINNILDNENEEGLSPKILKGNLTIKDLSIGFYKSKEVLLQRLNCTIPSGSIVVINGYNSSGKTSLCKAFLGLITPLKGVVLYDNIDLKKINISWLRSQISYLPQEIELFNLSIKENILINMFNKKNYDNNNSKQFDGLLIKVLNMVGLNDYLNNTKKGLNEIISENGRNLPLGIKKRIGLARALINDGKIIIFDEPTESLDGEGINNLFTILNNLRKLKKTIIIASHNPAILKSAGIIIDLSSKPIPRIGVRKKKNAK